MKVFAVKPVYVSLLRLLLMTSALYTTDFTKQFPLRGQGPILPVQLHPGGGGGTIPLFLALELWIAIFCLKFCFKYTTLLGFKTKIYFMQNAKQILLNQPINELNPTFKICQENFTKGCPNYITM